jgi:iron complex outermembrane receptor protein
MFTNTKIAKSISLALAFSAVSGVSVSTMALAQDASEADEQVEKIQVTGSRLRRADMEGSLPVTVIDRAAIEFSGQTSVADLLRNTSFNSTGSFRPQSGSSAQGVSQIDLRGIGASRSLVLIDGRRLARSPSTGSTQDLNAIPAAAVERVEILTDGASSVYGSDAIGGVINVITRKDFNGVELRLGAAEIEREGGDREEGSVIFGTSSDKGSMLGGVSWNKRDIIFARDFPWNTPGGSFFSQNWRVADAADRNQPWNLNQTLTDDAGADRFNSWTRIEGACDQGDFRSIAYDPGALGFRCGFDFTSVSADEASTGNLGFFLNSRYEINDDWSIFSNMTISKTNSFGRYAPSLAQVRVDADSLNNPTNPASPYYQDLGQPAAVPAAILHRFAGLGNRDNEVENNLQDLLVGVEGEVGDMFVEFTVRRNKARTFDIGRNYVVIPIAEQFLNEGTYLVGDLDRNPASVLNSMKATISRIGDYNQDEVFGSVQFDLFDMDGGAAMMLVGGEWRDIFYSDQYDSLSEGGVIGGSAGNSAGGSRQARALFAEAVFPIMDELEVTAALRYDDYSDYGSDVSPKLSVRYNPTDELVLRASWGKGFRAPTLDILTQAPAFSADSVSDDTHCLAIGAAAGCSDQINATVIANSALESETSNQIALGVAYEVTEDISFSLDYFNIKIDNLISGFSSQFLIDSVLAGDPIPSTMSVTRNELGEITSVVRGFGNRGDLETSGLDLNVTALFDFNEFGALRSNLGLSYTHDYTIDGGRNLVNDFGQPEYRGVLSNVYTIGDFDIAYNMNIIASTSEETIAGEQQGHVPSWITNDIQVTYNGSWGGRVTLGMQNVGGKNPPLFASGGRDYNFNLYDGYGRISYVRYTQSF